VHRDFLITLCNQEETTSELRRPAMTSDHVMWLTFCQILGKFRRFRQNWVHIVKWNVRKIRPFGVVPFICKRTDGQTWRKRWQPTTSSAEVKERVEPYIYYPSGSSWPVPGSNLPCRKFPNPMSQRYTICVYKLHTPVCFLRQKMCIPISQILLYLLR
jgi:hypothetical protein